LCAVLAHLFARDCRDAESVSPLGRIIADFGRNGRGSCCRVGLERSGAMIGRRAVARFVSVCLAIVLLQSLAMTMSESQTVRRVPLLGPSSASAALTGIHKIQHVIMVMQENRTFDSYFGTYPGAAGIPMSNGVPTVCVPDPNTGGCQR